MLTAFIMWLMAIFVVEPLYSDYGGRLVARGVPGEAIAQIEACRDIAFDAYATEVQASAWWGIKTTVRVLIGTRTPGEILGEIVPNCAEAFRIADEAIATAS